MLVEYAETWAKEQQCSIVRLWSSTARAAAHRFYERLGYRNIKTQYSFAKPLDPGDLERLKELIPSIGVDAGGPKR